MENEAVLEDTTKAYLGRDDGATRSKDATCRQASSAALFRSNKGRTVQPLLIV